MDSIEPFLPLIEKAKTDVSSLNEEETKNAFVMPFFQTLGYDTANPAEFAAEYPVSIIDEKAVNGQACSCGKIDYCILDENSQPLIIIEAKRTSENLDKHYYQLFSYFLAEPSAQVGVLTNGVEYRFYVDSKNANIMDSLPFFVVSLSDFDVAQMPFLNYIKKGQFDIDGIKIGAQREEYARRARELIERQMNAPDDDFVNYFVANIYEGKKTRKAVDAFRDIVGASISGLISDTVSERLHRAIEAESIARPAPVALPAPFPTTRRERLEVKRRSFRYYVSIALASFLLSGVGFFCYSNRAAILDYAALLMQR